MCFEELDVGDSNVFFGFVFVSVCSSSIEAEENGLFHMVEVFGEHGGLDDFLRIQVGILLVDYEIFFLVVVDFYD